MIRLLLFAVLFVLHSRVAWSGLFHRELFPEEYSPDLLIGDMRNLHIVMVGDSLMRYQYISLVHLLHYGKFPESSGHEDILMARTYHTWAQYFGRLTEVLAPNEESDWIRTDTNSFRENRCYRNPIRNLTVRFFQYMGDTQDIVPIEGSYEFIRKDSNLPASAVSDQGVWCYYGISDFLSNFISTLVPKPSLLVLNAGHHPNKYHDQSHRDRVVSAALSVAERVVWKTTSWRREALLAEAGSSYSAADPLMCAYAGLRCVDLSWTNYLSPGDFTDSLHFQPAIYSDINTQFLLQLRSEQTLRYTALGERYYDSLIIAESAHGSSADSKSFYVDTKGRLHPYALNHTTSATSTACPSKEVHRLPERQLLEHVAAFPITDLCAYLAQTLRDGQLVRASNDKAIYLIDGGKRRAFATWDAFMRRGFDLDQVTVLVSPDYSLYELGPSVT